MSINGLNKNVWCLLALTLLDELGDHGVFAAEFLLEFGVAAHAVHLLAWRVLRAGRHLQLF